MSRVTIDDIVRNYNADRYPYDGGRIEVVPRKIVEMIIEQCENDASEPKSDNYILGISNEANCIKRYAESLLKQFEADIPNKSDTYKSSEHEQPTPCTENVRLVSCPKCGGTGYETGTDGFDIIGDCERCNGTGKVSC